MHWPRHYYLVSVGQWAVNRQIQRWISKGCADGAGELRLATGLGCQAGTSGESSNLLQVRWQARSIAFGSRHRLVSQESERQYGDPGRIQNFATGRESQSERGSRAIDPRYSRGARSNFGVPAQGPVE